ncbi:MAG TPA: RagB/SusD family nutrient uptake outer membrane protein, partial [Petrimonas sp.]|nr:RagB/SusD family nutrient uptake outer membrane protein [Petrimonas sp.]
MRNIKQIVTIIVLGFAVVLNSCSDFMDIVPSTSYTEQMVFTDAALTQAFVNDLYNNIHPGAQEHSLDGLTDDAYFTHNYGQKDIVEAVSISQSNLQWYDNNNNPFKWQNRYRGIRYANIIINNIDNVPEKVGFNLDRMKGEAYYMRAHMYHELVRGFGGVPIVTEDFSLAEVEEMKKPRNTMRECLEFIVSDLEKAEEYLPATVGSNEWGRVTKFVATGLKARILLHVASPLYADRTINTLAVNQFDGDRMATYRAARDAAIKVIEDGPFELIDCRGGVNTERAEKFKAIMTDIRNSEQMFVRNY